MHTASGNPPIKKNDLQNKLQHTEHLCFFAHATCYPLSQFWPVAPFLHHCKRRRTICLLSVLYCLTDGVPLDFTFNCRRLLRCEIFPCYGRSEPQFRSANVLWLELALLATRPTHRSTGEDVRTFDPFFPVSPCHMYGRSRGAGAVLYVCVCESIHERISRGSPFFLRNGKILRAPVASPSCKREKERKERK